MNKLRYIPIIALLAGCTAKEEAKPTVANQATTPQVDVVIPAKGLPAYVRQHSLVPQQSVVACNTFDEAK